MKHYNLDAILAVGYRVRSPRGTAFRQWATARWSELLVKGFTLDQNKMHWAAHGHTAAEIVAERADARKPNMGLTRGKTHPPGRYARATWRLPRTTSRETKSSR